MLERLCVLSHLMTVVNLLADTIQVDCSRASLDLITTSPLEIEQPLRAAHGNDDDEIDDDILSWL